MSLALVQIWATSALSSKLTTGTIRFIYSQRGWWYLPYFFRISSCLDFISALLQETKSASTNVQKFRMIKFLPPKLKDSKILIFFSTTSYRLILYPAISPQYHFQDKEQASGILCCNYFTSFVLIAFVFLQPHTKIKAEGQWIKNLIYCNVVNLFLQEASGQS